MKRPAVITNPDIRALWDALTAMQGQINLLFDYVRDIGNDVDAMKRKPGRRKQMVEGGDV